MNENKMVCVLGTGPMGAAVARALLRRGHDVTVWNRTMERAALLAADGAKVARTPAEAVRHSELVIVTLAGMAASTAVLGHEETAKTLEGKTVVQLTSATVEASLTEAAWAAEHGIEYLKGYTFSYPRGIGTNFGLIFLAGAVEAFERHQPILEAVGALQHVGEDLRNPSIYATCAVWMYYANMYGLLIASSYARSQGIEMSEVLQSGQGAVGRFLEESLADGSSRIQNEDFSGNEASITTHMESYDLVLALEPMADAGMDLGFAPHLRDLMQRAIDAGDGDKDIAAVYDYLHQQPEI